MTKSEALSELAAILTCVRKKKQEASDKCTFGDFVDQTTYPSTAGKWKSSTVACNLDRLKHHLN